MLRWHRYSSHHQSRCARILVLVSEESRHKGKRVKGDTVPFSSDLVESEQSGYSLRRQLLTTTRSKRIGWGPLLSDVHNPVNGLVMN
jgi:hypothetical protein